MAFNKGDKSDSSRVRRGGMHRRKKVCVFCGDKNGEIDYKDVNKLKRYVSERGKILPRRITHTDARTHTYIQHLFVSPNVFHLRRYRKSLLFLFLISYFLFLIPTTNPTMY